MLPAEPEVRKDYALVRVIGDEIACALYVRCEDGSALYYANDVYARALGMDRQSHGSGVVCGADGSATAWIGPWDELREFGFIELTEARKVGLVPLNWEPPPQYLRTPPCTTSHMLIFGLAQPPTIKELIALRHMFPDLADRSLHDLRERLGASSQWDAGVFEKEKCEQLKATGIEHGLGVEVVDYVAHSIPQFALLFEK
jgi:hypothetical protein